MVVLCILLPRVHHLHIELPHLLPRHPDHHGFRDSLRKRQTRIDNPLSIHQLPIARTLILQIRNLASLLLEILFPLLRQNPFLGEFMPLLRRVMAKVKWHIVEHVLGVFRFSDQGRDGFTEETLVLRLRVELFAGELDDVCGGVVAGAS